MHIITIKHINSLHVSSLALLNVFAVYTLKVTFIKIMFDDKLN